MLDAIKKKLHEEVQALTYELTVTLPDTLDKAIAMGDLRENADYQAAHERRQFVQVRINHLRLRLEKLANLDLSKIPKDKVGLGSRVKVKDLDSGKTETYELVVSDGADFEGGQISVSSPLGRGLLDGKKGDKVDIRLPVGARRLKIVGLLTMHDLVTEES